MARVALGEMLLVELILVFRFAIKQLLKVTCREKMEKEVPVDTATYLKAVKSFSEVVELLVDNCILLMTSSPIQEQEDIAFGLSF